MNSSNTTTPGLRPLGRPRALHVTCDAAGRPTHVQFPQRGQPVAVTTIDQVWRIAEEWWRETSIARTYYQLRLDDGRALTCFHDESLARTKSNPTRNASLGAWFAQHY
jgi:hypothetical protein